MTRYMGTETEFGIATPAQPEFSPIISSTHAVATYAALHTSARSRWDYVSESPLKDLRGFDLRRYHTVPVVEPDAVGVANVVTSNGGRFYVDHAHPEFSTPEVTSAWDALRYDVAGQVIAKQAIDAVAEVSGRGVSVLKNMDPCPAIKMYKNNVDGKGASYGSHENYLFRRETDFSTMAQGLIPFFVARQVVIGAGRVGLGEEGQTPGFQISQRADYFYQEISLETTLNRGIINTRDEPHADADQWRRLHVIIGDANMSHTSILLKLGMTALVMDAIEEGESFRDLALTEPVAALQAISHDPTLRTTVELKDGRRLSALEILAEYRQKVQARTPEEESILTLWDEVTTDLAADPLRAADRLDWAAKWALISSYTRRGLSIDDPKIKLIDLQYHDVDPSRSLYHALVAKGRMRTLLSTEEIEAAVENAPEDSRAWLRGYLVSRWGEEVIAANWQSVILASPKGNATVRMDALDAGRAAQVREACEGAADVSALLEALESCGLSITYFS